MQCFWRYGPKGASRMVLNQKGLCLLLPHFSCCALSLTPGFDLVGGLFLPFSLSLASIFVLTQCCWSVRVLLPSFINFPSAVRYNIF